LEKCGGLCQRIEKRVILLEVIFSAQNFTFNSGVSGVKEEPERKSIARSQIIPSIDHARSSILNRSKHSKQNIIPAVHPQPPMAEEWREAIDKKTGRIYYWNNVTRQTTGSNPVASASIITSIDSKQTIHPMTMIESDSSTSISEESGESDESESENSESDNCPVLSLPKSASAHKRTRDWIDPAEAKKKRKYQEDTDDKDDDNKPKKLKKSIWSFGRKHQGSDSEEFEEVSREESGGGGIGGFFKNLFGFGKPKKAPAQAALDKQSADHDGPSAASDGHSKPSEGEKKKEMEADKAKKKLPETKQQQRNDSDGDDVEDDSDAEEVSQLLENYPGKYCVHRRTVPRN
jgi:hypothetical protein